MKLVSVVLIVIAIVVALFVLIEPGKLPDEDVPPGGALPGEVWDGRGDGNIGEQDAKQYGSLDLFWLGTSYGGFNLQSIQRSNPPEEVSLVYGSCVLSPGPETSCLLPLSISIRPSCCVKPEVAQAGGYRTSALENFRGEALLLRAQPEALGGQGTIVWTGTSFVSVVGPAVPDLLPGILNDLRRLNGGAEPGDPLPAPDFSGC